MTKLREIVKTMPSLLGWPWYLADQHFRCILVHVPIPAKGFVMTKLREILEDARDDLGNHHMRADPKFLSDEDLDFIEERLKPLIHKLEGNEAGALEYYNEEKRKVEALREIARKALETQPGLREMIGDPTHETLAHLRAALREIGGSERGEKRG